jgi:hypothetical protein
VVALARPLRPCEQSLISPAGALPNAAFRIRTIVSICPPDATPQRGAGKIVDLHGLMHDEGATGWHDVGFFRGLGLIRVNSINNRRDLP